jgi:hypothetical protein
VRTTTTTTRSSANTSKQVVTNRGSQRVCYVVRNELWCSFSPPGPCAGLAGEIITGTIVIVKKGRAVHCICLLPVWWGCGVVGVGLLLHHR